MNLQFGIFIQKKIYLVCIAEKYQVKIYCFQFAYQDSIRLSNFYDTKYSFKETNIIYIINLYYYCIVHNGRTISF